MTEEEAKQHINQIIQIKASGTKEGKQQVRIIEVDGEKNTPWGKGTVSLEFPYDSNRGIVKHALAQIEIMSNGKRKVKRKKGVVS